MTVAAAGDSGDLTIGEVCDHLKKTHPRSVNFGGMILTYGGEFDVSDVVAELEALETVRGQLAPYRLTEWQTHLLFQTDGKRWLRPLDMGGRSGSPHSAVLGQLQRKGLVEGRQRRGSFGSRGSKVYRLTEKGAEVLLLLREEGGLLRKSKKWTSGG